MFDYLIPDEYGAFIGTLGTSEKSLEDMEYSTFGITHPELGARFIEKWWPVSKQVVASVRKHHGPLSDASNSPGISKFVNCANQIANNHEMRNGVSPYVCPMSAKILKVLKLTDGELEVFVENTVEGVAAAEAILMV